MELCFISITARCYGTPLIKISENLANNLFFFILVRPAVTIRQKKTFYQHNWSISEILNCDWPNINTYFDWLISIFRSRSFNLFKKKFHRGIKIKVFIISWRFEQSLVWGRRKQALWIHSEAPLIQSNISCIDQWKQQIHIAPKVGELGLFCVPYSKQWTR